MNAKCENKASLGNINIKTASQETLIEYDVFALPKKQIRNDKISRIGKQIRIEKEDQWIKD